jgi:hypothetical protein
MALLRQNEQMLCAGTSKYAEICCNVVFRGDLSSQRFLAILDIKRAGLEVSVFNGIEDFPGDGVSGKGVCYVWTELR